MTTYEAGELLGISQRHIGRLIEEGRIPAVKKGRNWIVTAKLSDLKLSYRKGQHRNKRKPAPDYEGVTILAEVCDTLGMDRRRVAEMLLTGELVGSKINGKWYVDNESLRMYLKETAPDLKLQRIFHDLALREQEERAREWGQTPLPYTDEEHLEWWGISDLEALNALTATPGASTLRLRPIDRKRLMGQVGPICKRWRRRDNYDS